MRAKMALPFEFIMYGAPVSQQTRRRNRVREWTRRVRNVAEGDWNAEPPFVGEVAVTITYLYEGVSLDIDNIPKPILDALKGLVYSDDTQVSDLICRKRKLNTDLRVQNPSYMLTQSAQGSKRFVHIAIDDALDRQEETA